MARPDYEDATAGGGNESSTTTGDNIGWLQNSKPSGEIHYTNRGEIQHDD